MKSEMTRDNFITWLFEKFNIPESRQLKLKSDYENELPQDCDFAHLQKIIETKWRTPNSIPFPKTLKNYAISKSRTKSVQKTWEDVDPIVLKARKDKAFFKAHYAECRAAANIVMDKVEQIWGKRPGRKQCS